MKFSDKNDTASLMRAFEKERDADVFAVLVKRYLPVVFGAALRRCSGDVAMAEDVAQDVFADFARRIPQLRADDRIGAWLHRAATFRAGDVMKSDQRRRRREQQVAAMMEIDRLPESDAWEALSPVIDDALAALRGKDREAIVLRFIEGKKLRSVAETLGVSENAAQKRVERALTRLRGKLYGHGVVVGVAVLGNTVSSKAAAVVPSTLAEKVTSHSVAAVSSGGMLGFPFLKYASLGAAVTLVVGGIPVLENWMERSPAKAAVGGESVGGDFNNIGESRSRQRVRSFAEAKSLEEIVAAIGEILATPVSTLDFERYRALFARIPVDKSRDALLLMDQMWTPVMHARPHDEENSLDSEIYDLIHQWATREPEEALDWMLAKLSPEVAPIRPMLAWRRHFSRLISYCAALKWNRTLKWVEDCTRESKWKKRGQANSGQMVAEKLADELVNKEGIKGLQLVLDLQHSIAEPDYSRVFLLAAQTFEKSEEFQKAMILADEEITFLSQRRMSKEYLVQNWGKVDFRDALAWVKARPVDDLATFAWKLGLPAYEMEGFEINAHVDWLYSLDPEPDAKIERHFVEQVVEGMMGWNPTAVTDCLIRKELVSHALVTPILTKMNMFYWPGPNRALEPEDWRENAAMLLRIVLKSGDESAESLRSCVEVFDCPKEVAEFVEEVIKQP